MHSYRYFRIFHPFRHRHIIIIIIIVTTIIIAITIWL